MTRISTTNFSPATPTDSSSLICKSFYRNCASFTESSCWYKTSLIPLIKHSLEWSGRFIRWWCCFCRCQLSVPPFALNNFCRKSPHRFFFLLKRSKRKFSTARASPPTPWRINHYRNAQSSRTKLVRKRMFGARKRFRRMSMQATGNYKALGNEQVISPKVQASVWAYDGENFQLKKCCSTNTRRHEGLSISCVSGCEFSRQKDWIW